MTQFEYLSVLVSIIVGLALTQLLSSAARLIQLRRRVRMHAPTLLWMPTLFLIDVQVWWVAFERRATTEWHFFGFLLYLLIPVMLFLLSYLVLPDLGDEDEADLRDNFDGNRGWFFGLLAGIGTVSLAEQALRVGLLRFDADVAFRVFFVALSLVMARVRSVRVQAWNALFVLLLIMGYSAMLFVDLQ
jgi:hypothetical protein